MVTSNSKGADCLMGNRLDVKRLVFSRQTRMSVSHPMINKLVELDDLGKAGRQQSEYLPCA